MESLKKHYESPQLTVVTFKAELGYAISGVSRNLVLSAAWKIASQDPWDGSSPSNSGSGFSGGWKDDGGSAWF